MKFRVGDVIKIIEDCDSTPPKKIIVDIINTERGKRYVTKFSTTYGISTINLNYPIKPIDSKYKKIGVNKEFIKRSCIKRLQ